MTVASKSKHKLEDRIELKNAIAPQFSTKLPSLPTVTVKHQQLPFLKWAGGKRYLDLSAYLPTYQRYHEPFLGSGAIFFRHIAPNSAFLSDRNPVLVTTFTVVRDNPELLLDLLKKYKEKHSTEFYYYIRSQHHLTDQVEIAARMIYLNRTCFNGLYRENSKGEFNVPIGKYKNPLIYNPELIFSCSESLQNATINCLSYEQAIKNATAGDLVYADPPYWGTFTQYCKFNFTEEDQVKLKDVILLKIKEGVSFIISNSDFEFTRDLYKEPELVINTIQSPRKISCNEKGRIPVSELLIQSANQFIKNI